MKPRIGILISGRGSNMEALIQAAKAPDYPAEIVLVISNRADAPGLEIARANGIDAIAIPSKSFGKDREAHEKAIDAALSEAQINIVCLAGYMRLLSPQFIAAFPNRILNIHPSLLPAFPGLDAQQQAFDYGAKIAGCTVHFVDEHLDHGVIVLQRAIPVLDQDDSHSLAARILLEEHLAYTEAIARVLSGTYRIEGRRYLRNPAK